MKRKPHADTGLFLRLPCLGWALTLNGSAEQGIFISELQYGPAAATTNATPEPGTLGSILLMAGILSPFVRRLRKYAA